MAVDDVAAVRASFDAAFAGPRAAPAGDDEALLAVRVAGDRYALRLDEIAGLTGDRRIVPLPSPVPELLGLCGLRGGLVPVYSLAALLGYPIGGERPRWIVLCASVEPVALALGEVDGQRRVARAAVRPVAPGSVRSEHIRLTAGVADGALALIDLPSVVDEISRRCARTRAAQER